jgi:uncharacterized OB-fold protein
MSDRREELYPPVVEAYWDAIEDRHLALPECDDCRETFFPPRAACPYCLSDAVSLVDVPGTGTVYSYSVVRRGSHPERDKEPPYTIALIDLDNGPTMFSTIRDCPPKDVFVGMEVEVGFADSGTGPLPVFTPGQ